MIHSKFIERCSLYLSFFILLLFFACGGPSPGPEDTNLRPKAALSVHLPVAALKLNEMQWDSLVVEISSGDISPLKKVFSAGEGAEDAYVLEDLPPGLDRLIEVEIWSAGRVMYSGYATKDFAEGQMATVEIMLQKQTVDLHIQIPLGASNPFGIAAGSSVLDCNWPECNDSLTFDFPGAAFSHQAIPFGIWELQVVLADAEGDSVFVFHDTLEFDAQTSGEFTLQMTSLVTGASLNFILQTGETSIARAALPLSAKRDPSIWKDIVFSEFLANPFVSGNDYEWLELVNTTADTLCLDSCSIRKDRNSTGSTTRLDLAGAGCSAPGGFFIAGRDSAEPADFHYSSFVLSNSGQGLMLFCGENLIDSLEYFAADDSTNAYPLEEGHSMELRADFWQQGHLGSSWQLSTDSYISGGIMITGTPGYMN